MSITFECPHCQAALQVESDFAGKTGLCPRYKNELTVPEQSVGTPAEKADAPKKD